MIKNYLKIAWRNLLKNRTFTLLNVVGLSAGLAITALIFLWASFELGFDHFHQKIDRIYEVQNQYDINGEILNWADTPKILGPTLSENYPEIEHAVRYSWDMHFLFSKGEKRLQPMGNIVDPEFLKVFDFPLVSGNIDSALEGVNSVVLTQALAKKLFGDTDPMGQTITIDNNTVFTVTGVLKDLPNNTAFSFEFLMPWKYLIQLGWDDTNWSNHNIKTYVLLKEGVTGTELTEKIKNIRAIHDKNAPDMLTYLYPFSKTHLYATFENGVETGGRIEMIRLFALIGLFVLIIACINFMNLSTAKSEKRAKEVGIRKVVGGIKRQLVGQFLVESILICSIAAIFAVVSVAMLLPAFNSLVGEKLHIDWDNPIIWTIAIAVILVTGLLAGSYPAFYLSSFKPSKILKGTFKRMDTLITPRKVLVVIQFTVAITLITATLIINQQLNKVQNRNLGYNKEHLIHGFLEGDAIDNYELIKKELLLSGAARSITKTNSPITETWSNTADINWKGKNENDNTLIHRLIADEDVVKTMGLELISGRDFNLNEYPTDSTAAIINEATLALMGLENPIGKKIRDNGTDWHIVGLVKDFVINSPFQKVEPLVIEGAKGWFSLINIRLNPNNSTSNNLAIIKGVFKKYNPLYPLNYNFVDQEYAKKFEDEKRIENIASLFTLLTILISCLGLFGLASYMAENRVKEIGIRKVLGASISSITNLLSRDFLKLVLIAFVIATPITAYIMNDWLSDFDYRVNIPWWTFFLSGILNIIIAFLTISYQALRAATQKPVNSLRTE
ncbi:ABC transporter permease [Flagellimonas onchidii]|uniref:ABC transporter permease n=1 Tax=Flagellimonas onchidii TaxID=2562684 RepID=UPI0010A5C82E|nr:ABC transporter permease [Allomuricauda onchidii]